MPRIETSCVVPVPAEVAFALSQTYGELRYRWDPFVRHQHLLDGATRAGRGVRTLTRSSHRLTMISEYQSFRPPTHVGMRMVEGPWFFSSFSGGWNFSPVGEEAGSTKAVWRYNFVIRPAWLRPLADRIGRWLLQRDMDRRIAAFAKACVDPTIVGQIVLFAPDSVDAPTEDPAPSPAAP